MLIERDLRVRVAADASRAAAQALAEDGPNDITSEVTVRPDQIATGVIECRTGGVVAGLTYADAVAGACGLAPVNWYHATGTDLPAGSILGLLQGELTAILRAERPLLNFLQRASGIATLTQSFVEAVQGTSTRILHTRKTAPGLRLHDVSAVLAGGGHVHRVDLATTVMIKDNHWWALQQAGRRLADALADARARGITDCYVEVESMAQVEEACAAGASRLLIDNQAPEAVASWGRAARQRNPQVEIEATGGITLANARSYAEAGADYISLGVLTHSAKAADIALEVKAEP
ncbi:MAG TPA: carboxylating nicotinate-nucleotide diphosphorylase [Gemmatimonadales bacterium]|nr:carboxylating nicotinate-nucleotide diphosphorylase [Gemmatimonadales bacterium]